MRFRNLTLLFASTLTVMAGATIAPSLPGMEAHFSGTPRAQMWVQLILTIPGLMIALAAPLAGWLLDRWRKKQVLLWSVLTYVLAGTAGFWLDESLAAMLVSRVVLGIAVAGVMVTCTTLVADYFSGPQRARYMGLLAAFGSFGGVVYVGLAGWLAGFDWRSPFLVYLLAIVILPMVIAFIRDPDMRIVPEAGDVSAPNKNLLLFFFALAFLEILVLYLVPVHLPFYMQTLNGAAASTAGYAIAWLLLVMALVSCAYKAIQNRSSFFVLQTAGITVLAAGCLLLGFANHLWQVMFALTVMGLGLGVMRPNVVMWLMNCTPPNMRGRIMGGMTSSYFIGQFACPLLMLPLMNSWGYSDGFAAVGLFLLAVVAVLLAYKAAGARATAAMVFWSKNHR